MIGNIYNYEIEQKSFTFTGTLLDFIIDLQLNTKARIIWNIYSEGKRFRLAFGELIMEGADYEAWGNDDNYVIEWVCNQLGLTLKNQ